MEWIIEKTKKIVVILLGGLLAVGVVYVFGWAVKTSVIKGKLNVFLYPYKKAFEIGGAKSACDFLPRGFEDFCKEGI